MTNCNLTNKNQTTVLQDISYLHGLAGGVLSTLNDMMAITAKLSEHLPPMENASDIIAVSFGKFTSIQETCKQLQTQIQSQLNQPCANTQPTAGATTPAQSMR